jgi:putative permease
MKPVSDWLQRSLSDPQVVILALLLAFGFAVVLTLGDMLTPVLAGLVIAYLLEGVVASLERRGLYRFPSVLVVFSLFLAFLVFVIFGLLPLLSSQLSQLVQELPRMIARGQESLMQLPERYPHFISEEQVRQLITTLRGELGVWGQKVLTLSLASVVGGSSIGRSAICLETAGFPSGCGSTSTDRSATMCEASSGRSLSSGGRATSPSR